MAGLGIDRVTRLVAVFALLLVALLLGGGWTFHALLERSLRESSRQDLQSQGGLLRASLEAWPDGPRAAWESLDVETLRLTAGLDRLLLYDATGHLIGDEVVWGLPAPALSPRQAAELRLGVEILPPPLQVEGELFQSLLLPLRAADGATAAILYLESGEAVSAQLQALRRGLWTATGLGAAFVVFVLVAMALILAQARRRQRELDRAEHLAHVGTLAAGLAHEIRNPLAIIAGHAELFTLSAASDVEEAARRAAEIVDETERLQRLLEDFLSFARPVALRRERLEPAALWARLVEEQRILHPELQLTLEAPADLPDLEADPDRLRQLGLNLLANAAAAAGPGGRVQVELRGAGERFVARVHDSGPGVPASVEKQLFQPFVSGRKGGTGLGLAICAAVARAHGGSLRLSANGPGGAEFTLELPLRTPKETP